MKKLKKSLILKSLKSLTQNYKLKKIQEYWIVGIRANCICALLEKGSSGGKSENFVKVLKVNCLNIDSLMNT